MVFSFFCAAARRRGALAPSSALGRTSALRRELRKFPGTNEATSAPPIAIRERAAVGMVWYGMVRYRYLNSNTCSRPSIVRFANGPKRSMGHLLGGKKIIFLIRDIDDPAMAAASVESCRFVVLRSPWGRLGSVLYTCNRLQRMRGRFRHFWSISLSRPRPQPDSWAGAQVRQLLDPELSGEPQVPAYAV